MASSNSLSLFLAPCHFRAAADDRVGLRKMKVNILSVRADKNFQAIRVGNKTRRLSAKESLEGEIQKFLVDNPKAESSVSNSNLLSLF